MQIKPLYLIFVFFLDEELDTRYLGTFLQSLLNWDTEAAHFLLTWLWILIGGIIQFIVLCCSIKTQDYVPFIWKCFILLSSMALLDPTMFYLFGIYLVLSFKLNLGTAANLEE